MRKCSIFCVCLFLFPLVSPAASKNPADYPLRIHIYGHSETNFFHSRAMEEAKGEGRGNLFSDSDITGVDFSFDCSQKLKNTMAYETYPARWRKPGKQITVLLPVFGKAGSYWTCDFNTDLKDGYVYVPRKGHLEEEPEAEFKAWMARHDYDPVHGKDMPARSEPSGSGASDQ